LKSPLTYRILLIQLCIVCLSVLFLVNCSQIKYVPEGEYLLVENEFIFEGDSSNLLSLNFLTETGITEEELTPIIKQHPNKKVFVLRQFHLWLYNRSNQNRIEQKIEKNILKVEKKNKKITSKNERKSAKNQDYKVKELLNPYKDRKRTFGESLRLAGESPVLLDSVKTRKSSNQIHLYMLNKGYFNNSVRDSIVFLDDTITSKKGKTILPKKKNTRKAKVYFIVNPNEFYKVTQYTNSIKDSAIHNLVDNYFNNTLNKIKVSTPKEDQNFDTDKITSERLRITKLLQENGYLYFNKEFIYFNVDSAFNNHSVNITLGIQNYKFKIPGRDQYGEKPHKPLKIKQIELFPDYYANDDTTMCSSFNYEDISIHHTREMKIKPSVLYSSILFKEGDLYQKSLEEATYKRFNSLGTYRAVSIEYDTLETQGGLRVKIFLQPAKAQTFTIASDGTHTNGLFGIEGSMTYTHSNTFGGAEKLQISMSGGIEMQRLVFASDSSSNIIGEAGDINKLRKTFNTIEFGPKISLTFPKYLFIQKAMENLLKLPVSNPKTSLTASLNFQNRPDFKRSIEEFSFGWLYHEKTATTIRWNPLIISAISIDKSPEFEQRITELNDRFLAASYQDHIIAGQKLSYTYNDQNTRKDKRNTYYFKGTFESAGNLLRTIMKMSNRPYDNPATESYDLFNIRYAQFVKLSGDFRHFFSLGERGKIASRIAGGLGIPLGNLKEALPFEKSFFSGGTNGIRAWKSRTLGPGGYNDPQLRFDKIGDIQLEGNIELRFPIIDWIEGAFFVDAGNIWSINADSLRPGGQFKAESFVSEIAFGTGLGIRLDLDFFIIRLDLAAPFKNPSLPSSNRWIWEGGLSTERKPYFKPQLNLGIGFPF